MIEQWVGRMAVPSWHTRVTDVHHLSLTDRRTHTHTHRQSGLEHHFFVYLAHGATPADAAHTYTPTQGALAERYLASHGRSADSCGADAMLFAGPGSLPLHAGMVLLVLGKVFGAYQEAALAR